MPICMTLACFVRSINRQKLPRFSLSFTAIQTFHLLDLLGIDERRAGEETFVPPRKVVLCVPLTRLLPLSHPLRVSLLPDQEEIRTPVLRLVCCPFDSGVRLRQERYRSHFWFSRLRHAASPLGLHLALLHCHPLSLVGAGCAVELATANGRTANLFGSDWRCCCCCCCYQRRLFAY